MRAKDLILWGPEIGRVASEEFARLGPRAAELKRLLNYLPMVSNRGWDVARRAMAENPRDIGMASNIAWNAVKDIDPLSPDPSTYGRYSQLIRATHDFDDFHRGMGAHRYGAGYAGKNALVAEAVSDLIGPETYNTLVTPLDAARTFSRLQYNMAPRLKERFSQLANNLDPVFPEDFRALNRLVLDAENQNPILEALRYMGFEGTLSQRIKDAEALLDIQRGGGTVFL